MEFQLSNRGNEESAFEYKENDEVLAEIIWTKLGDIMVVEHTFVSEKLRGQGVAKQLLDRTADYAREKGFKIEAVCSYVVAAFEKSNAYDDIKA
ncbi:N-acetyltransferase [Viridibacillus sp. YIM B01967]|uniref:N-acetyltransferase n=1 Tax=Viridibacillus soli TaxID=2798301 RepID=A0ABS1H552_9BACL|nr:GNAT family N-acetyltransferase [Viridibacillus soli]MBK3494543.1 N-acetyltransferase [Viridibacillus soli]